MLTIVKGNSALMLESVIVGLSYLSQSRGLTITNLVTEFKTYNVNLGQFKMIYLCLPRPLSSCFSLSE